MLKLLFVLLSLVSLLPKALGDGVDWIDPTYVKAYSSGHNSEVAQAARAIVNRARSSAKKGPFTVTKGKINAPSGKEQDYLSWAPYHWPDCNWCSSRNNANGPKQNDYDQDDGSNGTTSSGQVAPDNSDDPLDDAFLPDFTNQLLEYSIETVAPTEVPRLVLRDESISIPDGSSQSMTSASSIPLPSTAILEMATSEEAIEADRRPSPTSKSSCTPSPATSMPPSATWTKCPYIAKDGKVNPDRNQLHGLSQLNTFAQSTVDNALASVLDNDAGSAKIAVDFINAFFLDPQTGMLPRIPWGQTLRGPSQRGSYMGVLDFRVLVKVANAIQILRVMNSPAWTSESDGRMVKWAKNYVNWLETSDLGARPKRSANNHSSFYYGQLAALKILVGDEPGALKAVQAYFSGPFREQIVSSGEQPFESTRTKPFHYRAFNLQAMMTVAKLGDYLGVDMWTAQTKYKSTIKTAVDYLIRVDPGHEAQGDALPLVAAALAAYGDDQKAMYQRFLENGGSAEQKSKNTKSYPYKSKTWWFYQQPDALKRTPVATHRHNHPRDMASDAIYQYGVANQDVLGNMASFAHAFNAVDTNEASEPSLVLSQSLFPPIVSEAEEVPITATPTISIPTASCTATRPQGVDEDTRCGNAPAVIPEGALTDTGGSGDLPVLHPERPEPFASTDAVELDEEIYVYWWQIRHLYEQSSEMKRSTWAKW